MSTVVAAIHRVRLQGAAGASWATGSDHVEYRVLANRRRRAYLAVVTIRSAASVQVVHGPPRATEPTVVHLSVRRVDSEREVRRGPCRDELAEAVTAAALAELSRAA